MGKNFQDNQNSIVNTADLTLNQMFDISAKLVTEQDEISNLETIGWEQHSSKYLSIIDDERIINLQRAEGPLLFGFCIVSWKDPSTSEVQRSMEGQDRMDHNFSGFDTLQLCGKVKDLLSRLGETPANFTGRILFMSMFNDISCGTKDNERECLANAKVVSIFAKKFGIGQWSFIGTGSEKKWSSMEENSPQGIWTISRRRSCSNLPKAHVQFSVLRHHCSEVNSEAKDMENCRFTLLPLRKQLKLFRIIVSANQEQLRTCVKNMNPVTIDQGDLIK